MGDVTEISTEDIAELRKDPDSFRDYLRHITGRQVQVQAEPAPAAKTEAEDRPGYTITHRGGWPLGTAASGPTPPPGQCSCVKCTRPPRTS